MRAGSWRLLGRVLTAPGFTSELMHLYLATEPAPADDDRLGARRGRATAPRCGCRGATPWRPRNEARSRREVDRRRCSGWRASAAGRSAQRRRHHSRTRGQIPTPRPLGRPGARSWPNFHPGALGPDWRPGFVARFPPREKLAAEWGKSARDSGVDVGLRFPGWEFGQQAAERARSAGGRAWLPVWIGLWLRAREPSQRLPVERGSRAQRDRQPQVGPRLARTAEPLQALAERVVGVVGRRIDLEQLLERPPRALVLAAVVVRPAERLEDRALRAARAGRPARGRSRPARGGAVEGAPRRAGAARRRSRVVVGARATAPCARWWHGQRAAVAARQPVRLALAPAAPGRPA